MKVPNGIDRVPGLCIRCSGTRPCLDCPVGEVGDCDGVELLDIQVWATTDTIFAFDVFTIEATLRDFSSQHMYILNSWFRKFCFACCRKIFGKRPEKLCKKYCVSDHTCSATRWMEKPAVVDLVQTLDEPNGPRHWPD